MVYFQQASKPGVFYYMINEERMMCTLYAFIQRNAAPATSRLLSSVSVGLGELAYISLHHDFQVLQVTVSYGIISQSTYSKHRSNVLWSSRLLSVTASLIVLILESCDGLVHNISSLV